MTDEARPPFSRRLLMRVMPAHVLTQERGREAFFDSYHMTVATSIIREYEFPQRERAAAMA